MRLVTPGTLTEDSLLDAKSNNYLLALARVRASSEEDRFALAWIDISTGEFRVGECDRGTLAAEIARIEPGEIIVSDAFYSDAEFAPYLRSLPAVTPLTRDVFDGATAERRLASFFGVATTASFGDVLAGRTDRGGRGRRPTSSARRSANVRRCRRPMREAAGATLAIDQATRSNLELIRTLGGERRGSLLAAVDRTVTAAGSRLLAQRLAAPLTDPAEIGHRLDAVAAFVSDAAARADLREQLKAAPDLARALSRIVDRPRRAARSCRHSRRDLCRGAHRRSASRRWRRFPAKLPPRWRRCAAPMARSPPSSSDALADELPAFRRDGSFVRAGYEPALDEARALRDESRRVIAALQVRYAETTGIRSLKIRHNNVLGYFVDVTAQHGEKLISPPLNTTFIHRQTLAGQVRFTTTELGELEAKIANAAERALAHELEIFDRLAAAVTAASATIKAAADALASVDVAAALAQLAVERDYVRPEVDGSVAFAIIGGRHPVVEQALVNDGGPFIANDCDLSPLPPPFPPPQAGEGKEGAAASGSSPARTWRANRRSSVRTR